MNKNSATQIIKAALQKGRNCLSEYEAKQVLAFYGFPVTREILIEHRSEIKKAAQIIGYPMVIKGCSFEIAHKTEKGLLRTDIRNEEEALASFDDVKSRLNGSDGAVLVQEMVKGSRELVMGMMRDEQFGPCVMFGLGGIFTEILKDISFRKAPFDESEAVKMMCEIRGHKIIDAVRGLEVADTKMLAEMLVGIGRIGLELNSIQEIDLNPVILSRGKPVVVDALIILG